MWRRLPRLALVVLLLLLLVPLGATGVLRLALGTDAGAGLAVEAVNRALAGRGVVIGGLTGAFPETLGVESLELRDRNGVWLRAEAIGLRWHPLRLAVRELAIAELAAGRIAVSRRPAGPAAAAGDGGTGSALDPPLPFGLALDRLRIDRLELADPVVGTPVTARVTGAAALPRDGGGAALVLAARRVDGIPGSLEIDLGLDLTAGTARIDVAAEEPAGGVLARLADLPDLPPLTIALSGSGSLDDLAVEGRIDARPLGTVRMQADLSRPADRRDARRLALDARLDPGPAVPSALAALIGGHARLALQAGLDLAAGAVTVDDLALTTEAAALDGTGRIETATLSFAADAGFSADAAAVAGVLPALRWTGPLTGTVAANGRLRDLQASIELAVAGLTYGERWRTGPVYARALVERADGRTVATADLSVADPASGLPGVDALLAGAATLSADLDLLGAMLAVRRAVVTLPGADLTASLSGRLDLAGRSGAGELAVELGTLAALDPLTRAVRAGAAITGAVEAAADWSVDAAGIAARLQVGVAGLDGLPDPLSALVGPSPTLRTAVAAGYDGAVSFEGASLSGAALSVTGEGRLTAGSADAIASLAVPDLAVLGTALDGDLIATVAASGPLAAPALSLSALLPSGSIAGAAVRDLALDVVAVPVAPADDGSGRPAWSVAVDGAGRIAGLPAGLTLQAERVSAADTGPVTLFVTAPGTTAEARLRWRAGEGPSGAATVTAGDLAALTAPWTGGAVAGRGALRVGLTPGALELSAEARDLAAPGVTGESVSLAARVADPFAAPAVDARLDAVGTAGPVAFETAALTVRGPPSDLAVSLAAAGTALALPFTLVSDAGVRGLTGARPVVDLARLDGRIGRGAVTLADPVRIALEDGILAWSPLTLTSPEGSVTATGAWSPERADLVVTVSEVTPAVLGWVGPVPPVDGRLDGVARLSGGPAARRADLSLALTALTPTDPGLAALGAGEVRFEARWDGARATAEGTVQSPRLGGLAVRAAIDAPADRGWPRIAPDAPLAAAIDGMVDLAALTPLLAAEGSRIGGTATVDLALSGPLSGPRADGAVTIDDGSLASALTGVRLADLTVRLAGDTTGLVIEEARARTAEGGSIAAAGTLGLGPGLPADLALTMDDALLADLDLLEASLGGRLSLTGRLRDRPRLAGRIASDRIIVRLPDQLPATAPPIPVSERGGTGTALPPDPGDGVPLPVADLDVAVSLPGRVFVRGRGLDAELAGDLTVTGTTAAPRVEGTVRLVRGQLSLAGSVIALTEGAVTFDGGPPTDPRVGLIARRQAGDATVRVEVSGRAGAPVIAFAADPPLPEDEVLARLLFGVPATELTAAQAVRLGLAASQLSGLGGGGPGLVGQVRSTLGLDRLDVAADPETGTASVAAEARVTDRITVGVEQGTAARSGRARVEFELTPDLALEAETGADARSRFGLRWQREY